MSYHYLQIATKSLLQKDFIILSTILLDYYYKIRTIRDKHIPSDNLRL